MELNFRLGSDDTIVGRHILQSSYFTVGDALRNNAKTIPDRIAVESEEKKLTFSQLNSRVNRLANAMSAKGVKRGDMVGVLIENRLEYCEIVYAAAKLGAIVNCLNWRLSANELKYCLNLTSPETIVVSALHRGLFEKVRGDLPFLKSIVLLDNAPETDNEVFYESLIENGSDSERYNGVHPEDALTILYTGGTTGYPKAAIISHRAIFARTWTWVHDLHMTAREAYVGWLPMFHMGGMDQMLASGIIGGKFIALNGFDPEKVASYLWKERLGWLVIGMAGTYEPLIKVLRASDRKPVGVRYVGSMADMVSTDAIAEVTRLTGAPFLNSFGSTETGMPPATNSVLAIGEKPKDLSKRVNTTCIIRLVDDQDCDVPQGEAGELIMRGPTIFSGYWNNVEANKEEFRGGWFHMGDVFIMNPNGTINYSDRKKYIIKSGGENIYPAEIERVLKTHPAVVEAVVVRVSDHTWGEVPKAYVTTNTDVDAETLIAYCKKNLASYKKPRYVEFIPIERFPLSGIGKIQRSEVEKWNK